ncbi:hypothetical protein HK098_006554 [Nowakowskiella sp. JEL0407]|nr:hypothetical protein HK098_006554 [Nowakowskiella sp. JEL0407]
MKRFLLFISLVSFAFAATTTSAAVSATPRVIPPCPTGSSRDRYGVDPFACVCDVYWRKTGPNGECCPGASVWDTVNKTCKCEPGYSGDLCEPPTCPKGMFREFVAAPDYVYNPHAPCRCYYGFTLANSNNPKGPCCPENFDHYDNRAKKCVCKKGFELNASGDIDQCNIKPCPVVGSFRSVENDPRSPCLCPENATAVKGKCVCKSGLVLDTTSHYLPRCVACPENSTLNNGTCVCKAGMQFSPITWRCELICPGGQYDIGGVCQCPQYYAWKESEKICVKAVCSLGYEYNSTTMTCEPCKEGYEGAHGGGPASFICVPKCGPNFEDHTGNCLCQDQFGKQLSADGTDCICKPGLSKVIVQDTPSWWACVA